MTRGELLIEKQIREECLEEDAKREEEARLKKEIYAAQCDFYRRRYPRPQFYDAEEGEGPRPEIYPRILAQVKGLVHVLRWAGWAGAYAVTSTHREQYVTVESIRFWLPLPKEVDPPEDFYGKE